MKAARVENLLISLLLLLAAGCHNKASPSGGGGASTEMVITTVATITPTLQSGQMKVPMPLVFKPAYPAVSPTLPPVDAVQTIDEPATPQPFILCSPLVDTALSQLAQIISQPYQPPPPGREERHHGVDFAYYHQFGRDSIEGAGIQTVLPGYVAASLANRFPYGNAVMIETPASRLPAELSARISVSAHQSLYILFAHLHDPPLLALGESVDACQLVGSAGRSGNAGGAHLHMEARLGPAEARFESMAFYIVGASEIERSNYLSWRIGGDFQHLDPMSVLIPPGN